MEPEKVMAILYLIFILYIFITTPKPKHPFKRLEKNVGNHINNF